MKALSEKLKQKNLKVTPQRLAIYHDLYHTTRHPSAENIYNALEREYPTMSLATVYKTLDALKKAGLIQELNVGEDSFRYDANTAFHAHMLCKCCNNVYDVFEIQSLEKIRHEIAEKCGFEVEREQIYFFGRCAHCKE
ncbi:MAG: transcriptional repressor [Clostridiales bacterium]|jgi:Fur family peroxide stress response transcriptional regulator|nr:transcriptional repressor [Clostridiales bacterium]